MNIHAPDHPIWTLLNAVVEALKVIVTVTVLGFVLYANADDFDATELKSMAEFAGLLGIGKVGLGAGQSLLKRRKEASADDGDN